MLPILLDRNPTPRSATFLAGVGRSGTTWVAEVINAGNDYRLMFEPFYPDKVPVCREFRYRQYLRQDDSNPKYLSAARAILSGQVRNRWVDKYNARLVASKRLIKDIRANLLLRWLNTQFPEVPVVLLIRHPLAVAVSKLKSGWGTHLNEFLEQPDLMADHLAPFEGILRSAETDFDKHIILWCVENYVPLKQFAPGEVYVAFYERLCLDPDVEFARLFKFLSLELTDKHRAAFIRPSAMSRAASPIKTGQSLIDTWRRDLSDEQVERASNVLAAFGLSRIYGADSMPSAPLQQPRTSMV